MQLLAGVSSRRPAQCATSTFRRLTIRYLAWIYSSYVADALFRADTIRTRARKAQIFSKGLGSEWEMTRSRRLFARLRAT
jgi:hypothetical protein